MTHDDFTKGEQPCKNFDGYEAEWGNIERHTCYGFTVIGKERECDKTVSFCKNCNKDHHEGGYETCRLKPKTSNHSINADGYCNMGCC